MKFKKFFKKLLRVAAIVAVVVFAPALAASIATAVPALAPVMTSAFGAPLVGAAIGGYTSVATGGKFMDGALIGGTLGYVSPMLGAGTPGGFLGTGYGASAGATAGAGAGVTAGAGAGGTVPPPLPRPAVPGVGSPVPPPAAPSTFLGTVGKVASTGATALTALSAVQTARLAASIADGSTQGLTPEEIALRERYQGDLEELAATNRAQYDQLVSQGRDLINRGTANPELAYGQSSAATQRAGLDLSRGQAPGMSAELQRRTAIDAARAGGGAVVQEQTRADSAQAAGIGVLRGLGSAPQGASAALMLQADADRKRRDEEEAERLRRLGVGAGALKTTADTLSDLFPATPATPATP
jgi:hypothetical protein